MLRIEIPSTGQSSLTFSELGKYDIPAPLNGFGSEINNNVLLAFEDEQQAIDYAHSLDVYAQAIDHNSHEFFIMIDIVQAIGDDAFVQSYIQS